MMDAAKLSPKQAALRKRLLAAVHAEKNRQGIDQAAWETMIQGRYGASRRKVTSSGKLSIDHLIDLKNHLTGRKSAPPARSAGRRGPNVYQLITPAQALKIQMMAGLIEWKKEGGMVPWCEKFFGFSEPKTSSQANRMIEGLKALFENQCRAQYGDDWKEQDHKDNPTLSRYIQLHPPGETKKGAKR